MADDLMSLVRDLGDAAHGAEKNLRKAIEVTARHVKDDARKSVKGGSSTWSGLVPAIDYDVTVGASGVEAEIGYDKGRAAGPLGNIREFGAPGAHRTVLGSVGGEAAIIPTAGRLARPPHSDLKNALKGNEADFEKGISMALDSLLKEHGL